MISLQLRAISPSTGCSFPKDIFLLKEFKALVNGLAHQMGFANRFHPRLYSHADFIMAKLYGLVRQTSTHVAVEALNTYITAHFRKKYHLEPKKFCDHLRKRRFVPHQTDVDKYFRRFTEKEVQNLFGNLNMALCRKISHHFGLGQKWRFMVDNTEYAYYGKTESGFEQCSYKKHMGTKRIRLFQGHVVHSQNMTLFTDFYLLKKGMCRWLSIPHSADWVKWNEFNLNYALMDREFYRVQLVKKLKDRSLAVILPAKQYSQVRVAIQNFLVRKGKITTAYLFKQKSGAQPWQSSVWVQIVVVGHDDQSPWKIRQHYETGRITFDEAKKQLSAFFTTIEPWENTHSWVKWLTKTYKIRWNQETGFCSLNRIHDQYRYRNPITQLAELYLRALIHNGWQFYRNQGLKQNIHHQHLTLFWYKQRVLNQLEREIMSSAIENVKYLQKRKRRLYFES